MQQRSSVVALVILSALAPPAPGQPQGFNRYEGIYGTPVDVSIDDLVDNPASYEQRAVRTKGRLEPSNAGTARNYSLRSTFGRELLIVPVAEISGEFEHEAIRWMGQELEVTGVFRTSGQAGTIQSTYVIQFWNFLGPPEREEKGPLKATTVTLEVLVRNPGARDGQMVRVVGKFRGRNLYGDLPVRSQKESADWVVKDDLYAAWVTGRKPKGDGWRLDTNLKRDTGKWVEVIGRPETRGGITYIRAQRLALATPPTPTSEAQAPSPPPERPKVPPVVVFALPLDGDPQVPSDARFQVQFSKDMDEDTFKGRILLRYAGPRQPGDREFDGIRLGYDGGRRSLTVDPGDVLRQGRQLELLLLPGIADTDGLSLIPRAGRQFDGAVDVLSWQIGG